MALQLVRNGFAVGAEMVGDEGEIDRVPMDNGTDDKVEAGSAEGLAIE